MEYRKHILVSFLALVVVCWFACRCNHNETITKIVTRNDLSKDGMTEVVCTKCNEIINTQMIDVTEGVNRT